MNRSARSLQVLALTVLATGLMGLDCGTLLAWLSAGLLLMAALKLIEARSLPEQRLVSLLGLIAAGVQGAQQPELLPSLLQLLASGLALAGLLALELGAGLSWRAVLRRSLAVLVAALPVALMLFLLVPRMGPLWQAPSLRGAGASAAVTGLSAERDPGSIASLANDSGPAARVSFSSNTPPAVPERYWRVLVHQRFDGRSWLRLEEPASQHRSQPTAPGPPAAPGPSQVWRMEPSPVDALPWAGTGWGSREQLQTSASGELQLQQPNPGRQAYLLRDTTAPARWQQQPPTLADLTLPLDSNPRLEALGASWRRLPRPEQRLATAQAWFSSQGFRYSRTPGALPEQRGLDVFLFERREGFCGHYASAFTALMRAAGVPARVVSGYLGGRWVQPLGGPPFLELRQSDVHAWSEVWLPERGWLRIDPSIWISNGVISSTALPAAGPLPWLRWLQRQWWGLDLAWNRWWLGFDRACQEALLQRLFGEQRPWLGAVLLTLGAGMLALGLAGLRWLGPAERPPKRRRQLNRLLQRLQRQGIVLQPGESLEALAQRAGQEHPAQARVLRKLATTYNQLRFAPLTAKQRRRSEARWRLLLKQV